MRQLKTAPLPGKRPGQGIPKADIIEILLRADSALFSEAGSSVFNLIKGEL